MEKRIHRHFRIRLHSLFLLGTALALSACSEPPSWQNLLAGRIVNEFPGYQAEPTANGGLTVTRPGQSNKVVDVDDIARFCQRGPKDCNYAIDQMLLDLRGTSSE